MNEQFDDLRWDFADDGPLGERKAKQFGVRGWQLVWMDDFGAWFMRRIVPSRAGE